MAGGRLKSGDSSKEKKENIKKKPGGRRQKLKEVT